MLGEHLRIHARQNALEIDKLPYPDETWKVRNVQLDISDVSRLSEVGVVKVDEYDFTDCHTWRVDERCYEVAMEYLDNTERFDCCGARGVTNNDGDLECIRCGEPVSEEEFLKVTA